MATIKIEMDNKTKRWHQGLAAAIKVTKAHAETEFPSQQVRINLFWFYVGAMATGEHGCETQEDFTHFALGADIRAPRIDDDQEEED